MAGGGGGGVLSPPSFFLRIYGNVNPRNFLVNNFHRENTFISTVIFVIETITHKDEWMNK